MASTVSSGKSSDFPGGFPAGVSIRGIPFAFPQARGQIFWVDNSTNGVPAPLVAGSDSNRGTYIRPFATIQAAVNACLDDNGDIIFVAAMHAETISTAGGLTLNKKGISVIGLGNGPDRPTLTFATSTAATLTVTAAGVALQGFLMTTSVDQIVSPVVVSANGCFFDFEWRDGSSILEALRAVLTTSAADNLAINLKYVGFPAGSHGVNAIRLIGGDNVRINIDYYGILTTAVVEFLTTASTNVEIVGTFYVSGTTDFSKDVVDTVTGSTWGVQGFDAAAGLSFDGGSGKAVASGDVSSLSTQSEAVAVSATAAMVNGNTIFTLTGPVQITALVSECVTTNDGTASTLQYQSAPTVGSATTFSGASASLAAAAAGASVVLQGTALSTAPVLNASGAGIMVTMGGGIYAPAGTIKMVIGTGSTTGTWRHLIRYRPLVKGATVS